MAKLDNIIVVGLFWGDEGKAKIIDYLSKSVEIIIRFQGGANAGHSVEIDGKRYVLHQVPTGILRPEKQCIMGAGTVINLQSLIEELHTLESQGIEWRSRLSIDPRAHIVLPYHKQIEKIYESHHKIGTTIRGIGPAYSDKALRIGIRIGELPLGIPQIEQKLDKWIKNVGVLYSQYYNFEFQSPRIVAKDLIESMQFLGNIVIDKTKYLDEIARTKGGILAEGAQGTMLSINWGTYPYVTSSETIAGGSAESLCMDLRLFNRIVGVSKAFCTRVGMGAFPTEGDENTQDKLRGSGEKDTDEFGATTGRPRRCGWLDGVILKNSSRINGIDELALTKLDALSGINPIKFAVEYKSLRFKIPSLHSELENAEPIYENFEGFNGNITEIRKWEDIPKNAKLYIKRIQELSGSPVKFIGIGPDREDIITI